MSLDNSKAPFLRQVSPWPDESLPSIYVRLAHANHYETVGILLRVISESIKPELQITPNLFWNPLDPNLFGNDIPRFFESIAPLLRISAAHLRTTCLPDFAVKQPLAPPVVQYCPACLQECLYHRMHWLSLLAVACPRHACLLINQCPHCRRTLHVQSVVAGQCRCRYDLRVAPTTSIASDEMGLLTQQRIQDWITEKVSSTKTSLTAFDEQPIDLQYHIFDWLQNLVAKVSPHWSYVHHPLGVTDLADQWPELKKSMPSQRFSFAVTSMKALMNWPDSFIQFLIAYLKAPSERFKPLSMVLDTWSFNTPDFKFVVDAFEPLLAEEYYPLQFCVYEEDNVDQRPFGFISVEQASKRLGTVLKVVLHLIALGVVVGRNNRRDGMTYVRSVDITQLQARWEQTLSVRKAACWLGTSPRMVVKLTDAGIIAKDSSSSGSRRRWR